MMTSKMKLSTQIALLQSRDTQHVDTCSNGALRALSFKRLEIRAFDRFIEKTREAFIVLRVAYN